MTHLYNQLLNIWNFLLIYGVLSTNLLLKYSKYLAILVVVDIKIILRSLCLSKYCLMQKKKRSNSTNLSCTSSRMITLYFSAFKPFSSISSSSFEHNLRFFWVYLVPYMVTNFSTYFTFSSLHHNSSNCNHNKSP